MEGNSKYPITSVLSGSLAGGSCSVVSGKRSHRRSHRCSCLPSYHWRWFGSKGMFLVLLWSFAAFTLLNYLLVKYVEGIQTVSKNTQNTFLFSCGAVFCPFIGLLADTYIGRYRVIKCSLIVMWAGVFLWCVTSVVAISYGHDRDSVFPAEACVTVVLCLAVGIFQVNILQFSIDQLLDASSEEIISFVVWYIWAFFSSKAIIQLLACTNTTLPVDYGHQLPSCLYVSVVFTAAVTCDALCHHWLIKEPVTPNPLRLILKVLHYAATNKYPRNRSAFWSWDTKQSRINLAKMQYGGPFTSREVEDVKTFFRLLLFMFVYCLFFVISINSFESLSKFQGPYVLPCAVTQQMSECLKAVSVTYAGYLLVLLSVPLIEFVLRPFLRKWFLKLLRIKTRFFIGGVLMTLHLLGLISLEVVGSVGPISELGNRKGFTCKGYLSGAILPSDWCDSDTVSSYYWLIVLSCVHVVGQCLILTAGLEFVCAQAPSSMKGTVVGFMYFFLGLSFVVLQLLFMPFYHTVISVSGVELGCVFWFLVTCTVCTVILGLLLGLTSRGYKNRERDEDAAADLISQ